MKYNSKLILIWTIIFSMILISFLWVIKVLWGTYEALKMIDYKDKLSEQWIQANYLNSISDIIVGNLNNEYLEIINKYKEDINIDLENTYFTQNFYKSEGITFNNSIPNNSITFVNSNWDAISKKEEINIWNDYYAWNELAPKNPTSILPIHKPCERVTNQGLPISYTNCETFITTDNQPLFISYFENGNEYQWWGFTIVEVRNKVDESLVSRFFMWWSKKWNMALSHVLNKSYTYWILQTQDRSNLYIPGASWNLNLNWIFTTSYDTLNNWDYTVYFQNINKFGLKSDKIKAWFLTIIPTEDWLQNLHFIDITNLNTLISKNIIWSYVSINYKKNVKIRINNPGHYVYDILSTINWITKNWDEFIIDELIEWDNIFNLQIKDQAGNILDNMPLIVTVDTIPPTIHTLSLDHNFLNKPTTDWWIALIRYFNQDYVNDNIDFSWIDGWFKTPFSILMSDNVSLSGTIIQYSITASWSYNNVIDYNWIEGLYKFNVDTSFINNDWKISLYFRAIDQFGNISSPKILVFNINREATAPKIITNNSNDIVTINTSINIKLELDEDIVKVLYDGYNLGNYEPFSNTYDTILPLQLWEKKYIFNVIDMMWNKSFDSYITIIKNPTPREGINWQDETIHFEWGVTTNQLNLQRVTWDWSAGEVFSR